MTIFIRLAKILSVNQKYFANIIGYNTSFVRNNECFDLAAITLRVASLHHD